MLEAYMEILALVATVFGSMMSLAHFPQVIRIYRRKSSADVSLTTYSVFLMGVTVWFLYGLSINNAAIIIANFIGIIGTTSVIATWFKYRQKA